MKKEQKIENKKDPEIYIEVFYDETAKMWKVVLRYSQNIDGDQAIYINDRGITQMVVTYTEENDPTNVG